MLSNGERRPYSRRLNTVLMFQNPSPLIAEMRRAGPSFSDGAADDPGCVNALHAPGMEYGSRS